MLTLDIAPAIAPNAADITQDIAERVEDLRRWLNRHNHLYYVQDAPEISDAQYDGLMRELRRIEAEHPELITPESPSQRVGAEPAERFDPVEHPRPMFSLANAFDAEEFAAWHKRVANLLERDAFDMVCELKFDGLAVALTYENGVFARGATRGNGLVGEDVTLNLRTIKSIPLALMRQDVPRRLEVRGEVYFPKSLFAKFNAERAARGEQTYANPRNTAAGSLRQLDPRNTAQRPLDIFVYSLGYADPDGALPETHWDTLQYLKDLGFKVSEYNRRVHNAEDAVAFYEGWLSRAESLDAAADGVVIKIDRLDYQRHLGVVGREPRWAVAYKFPAEQSQTRLLDIRVNVGRTGSLNPYAVLEPVVIGGATVKQATLHNEAYIREKDLRIGDWVIAERAGEVIPQVVSAIADKRNGGEREFKMPQSCPSCGQGVVSPEDEAMSYCVNAACPAQLVRLLEHFVSRGAMDIEGMGVKWGELLIQQGLIRDVADIYRLRRDDLAQLNLLDAIDAGKRRDMADLLDHIGIPLVGKKSAELLAAAFPNLAALMAADEYALTDSTPGITPRVARSIAGYFTDEEHIRLIAQRGATFLEQNLIADLSDLWHISKDNLRHPERMRQKSVSNLLGAIEASKRRPLARLLAALGIRHVGAEIAELLARTFTDIDALMSADEEALTAIPAIGPRIAESVASYFSNDANRKVIEKLRDAGVRLQDAPRAEPAEQPFAGKRFVVTGRLQQFSRSQIQAFIKERGGAVSGSVSKKTDYLVAGEDAGSKLADAERLEVETLSEDEFLKMLPD